jgi:hypothetical protein
MYSTCFSTTSFISSGKALIPWPPPLPGPETNDILAANQAHTSAYADLWCTAQGSGAQSKTQEFRGSTAEFPRDAFFGQGAASATKMAGANLMRWQDSEYDMNGGGIRWHQERSVDCFRMPAAFHMKPLLPVSFVPGACHLIDGQRGNQCSMRGITIAPREFWGFGAVAAAE